MLSSRLSHNLKKMSNEQIDSSLYMVWQGMNVVAGVSLPNDQEAVYQTYLEYRHGLITSDWQMRQK